MSTETQNENLAIPTHFGLSVGWGIVEHLFGDMTFVDCLYRFRHARRRLAWELVPLRAGRDGDR